PITDIASDLIYPELAEDVREVRRTLITVEKQVLSRSGSWFNANILPYHTLEDKIDGVIITFVNITKSKELEDELLLVNDRLLAEVKQAHKEIAASKD
ncbi:MAG: PAS domain-containing protein, partial [Clostridiaceae bacterium]|nr:PAS domain-containing protein [Clostridiaceae bacterium]